MFVAFALLALAGLCQANYPAYAPAYAAAPLVYAAPAKPIYAQAYIPTTVKVGESHINYKVPEHQFRETSYETPGMFWFLAKFQLKVFGKIVF